jgi:uncharacterized protein YndB with AHSA1/START domain
MDERIIARVSTTIDAPVAKVWDALVTPELIGRYMFGATVLGDWSEGGSIVWKGEWKGKPYEDKGVILAFEPRRRLRYTHYSPLSGLPDVPDSYHTVTVELAEQGGSTRVSLAQDNNPTEEARGHSERNWRMMLDGLKKLLEEERGAASLGPV